MKRAIYLDNFKGIAAFFVMVHHLFVAYLPVSYYGNSINCYYNTPFMDWLSQTPFAFLINGNFWVFVFFMVSGYLMFIQGSKLNAKTFSSKFLNRYIKLLIPVIPICVIVFLLKNIMNGSLFYHIKVGMDIGSPWLQNSYHVPISLSALLLSPFTIFLKGDVTFSNAFWMLDKLLISSLLVLVVAYTFQNVKKYKRLKYALICFAILFLNHYYLPTFLGGLIYLLSSYDIKKIFKNRFTMILIAVVIFIVGVVCAGYPSGRIPSNFYTYLEKYRILKEYIPTVDYYHILGAFCILILLINSSKIKNILEWRGFSILGKNSYSIYLIHIPIIYILSPYLFVFFLKWTNRYFISTCITIFITCAIVIFASIYYTKFTTWLRIKMKMFKI